MKILITTDSYEALINGVSVSVKNLSSALRNAGNEVRILTLSPTYQSYRQKDTYFISSMPLPIYPDVRASFSLRDSLFEEIEEWTPDVIHSQSEFFTFHFARRLAKRLQIPLIHTYHTLYECYTHYFCPNKTLGRKIVSVGSKYICNRADAVIAPTKKTAHILRKYGIDAPIEVIPTGLSLEQLQKPVDISVLNKLKRQLHIPETAPVIVTLGRVAQEKNIDFLIQQMLHPILQNLKLHLVIVGDGPDRERLETLVHQLQLRKTVHFTGMVLPNEICQYYRLGNVFVSASNSETQGLTYIEAMACGLPLLCLKDSCLESVLVSGENGYFFEDENSFAERCFEIFSNKKTLQKLSENALIKSSEFSKEMFASRILQLYASMILEKEEPKKCTRFVCIPKQIWQKVTEF